MNEKVEKYKQEIKKIILDGDKKAKKVEEDLKEFVRYLNNHFISSNNNSSMSENNC